MQGVGFRDALRAEALRLRVSGWVRNRADGSVEALLQGDAAAVDRLVDWARRGPALARVQRVEEQPVEAGFARAYSGLERWPTA